MKKQIIENRINLGNLHLYIIDLVYMLTFLSKRNNINNSVREDVNQYLNFWTIIGNNYRI